MRSGLLASVALVTAIPAFLSAQEPKDHRRIVTVEGCVEKSWLKVFHDDNAAFNDYADKYHLHGPKDLMKTLTKDLNGHLVEVTGALSDPSGTQGTGKDVMIGKKTRVYTNERERTDVPPIVDPTIEVSSFRDVDKSCTK